MARIVQARRAVHGDIRAVHCDERSDALVTSQEGLADARPYFMIDETGVGSPLDALVKHSLLLRVRQIRPLSDASTPRYSA